MNTANQTVAADLESLVAEVADRFTDEVKQGHSPSVEEYARRHPEIAHIIRQVFPSLAILDDFSATGLRDEIEVEHTTGVLGDFRILRELGRGGMGVVYEAEQISLGRRVALKVLPFAAILDKQQLARFKNEARAAATLDHPNIVAIHSVGSERGVHYYAMQLIEGQSLSELITDLRAKSGVGSPSTIAKTQDFQATENGQRTTDTVPVAALSTLHTDSFCLPAYSSREYFRAVARLGIQAAEALDHAHASGILHRDIKPANLLLDDDGKLWITDFGLARIEADAGMTMTGDLLGTLRYMSPEQALGKRAVVDHRTDIYSLGVTLYELLALRPALAGNDRQELLRQIAFEEPRKLRQIAARIPPDLETIILKSIEKNPTDRYGTAKEVADDLRRFDNSEPIKACPATIMQRTAKWSRQHPAAVWTVMLVLLATTVLTGISAALIIAAYHREAGQRRQAEAVSQFLVDALGSPRDNFAERNSYRPKITVAEVLDRSVRELQDKFSDDPLTKAQLLDTIGKTYGGLGLYSRAIEVLKQARDLRAEILGKRHPDTLSTMATLALAYESCDQDRVQLSNEALSVAQETFNLRKEILGPDNFHTLASMMRLAVALVRVHRADEAVRLGEKAFKGLQDKLGPEDGVTLNAMGELTMVYDEAGRKEQACALLEQVLKLFRAKYGQSEPDTLTTMNNLANCYSALGRWADAVTLLEEAVKLTDADDPHLILLKNNLAQFYLQVGRADDAISLSKTALELSKAKLGGNDPFTVDAMYPLASGYARTARWVDALPLLEQAVKLSDVGVPKTNQLTKLLREAHFQTGRYDRAKTDYELLVVNSNSPYVLNEFAYRLATDAVDEMRDGRQAVELAQKACKLTDFKHPQLLDSLAAAYAEAGDFESAVKWSDKALELLTDMSERIEVTKHRNSFKGGKPWRETSEPGAPPFLSKMLLDEMDTRIGALEQQGKVHEARLAIEERLDLSRRLLGMPGIEDQDTLAGERNLDFQRDLELFHDGKSDEATTRLNKTLDNFSSPKDPWQHSYSPNDVGIVQSDELYNKLASLRPQDRLLRIARTKYLGSQARWNELAELLEKVNALDAADWQGFRRLAVVQLYLGDAANYKRTCQELIKRFGDTDTPTIKDCIATTCLLTTQDEDDLRLSERRENVAFAADPTSDFIRATMALIDYRRSRFADAVKKAQQSRSSTTSNSNPSLKAQALVIEALAQQRLGKIDDAKELLNEVVDIQQKGRVKDPTLFQSWIVWLEVDILRYEAEALINGKPTSTPQPNVEKK